MSDFWRGKRVLVTGHTGFKGAWLSLWLTKLGAAVTGYSLAPKTNPSLFELTGLGGQLSSNISADINDQHRLGAALTSSSPEIVFHLAAQALVRDSYSDPVGTFATNVGGVATLLDSVRRCPSVRAVVVVTSDKCYENREWVWPYREIDRLGGRDPYSASKGCAEIATRSMQLSFFAPYAAEGHPARIASVRAGNVIGGGDWANDRLVPDIVRGCLGPDAEVRLRNPNAIRPWQHVLEPLGAYLEIAEKLALGHPGIDEAWNIGPEIDENRPVIQVAEALAAALGVGRVVCEKREGDPHEATLLQLDCQKAKSQLRWRPRLQFADAIRYTADWYAAWKREQNMAALTRAQIDEYEALAA
ncbi:CDP-glucose 4,6-dehydratase [uncultured Bradyrhizobium sp.]|jgi:CDP-glucose 4,6-dehydratase|uniref:CDP-glucose 4,6-dehydratase n=1 Tax=uncultured Bradyrhizobium sp. TaxID=199684 RepID=UPI002620F7F9|nr:CDP-glucose 4,6-dehydratase [uncultured Bradyrhizobium sp.]